MFQITFQYEIVKSNGEHFRGWYLGKMESGECIFELVNSGVVITVAPGDIVTCQSIDGFYGYGDAPC
jgi:hypothetical protein